MDRDRLERLLAAREEAEKALSDLVRHVAVAWYGDNFPGPPERSVDAAFVVEYKAAQARRDEAEAELTAFVTGERRR